MEESKEKYYVPVADVHMLFITDLKSSNNPNFYPLMDILTTDLRNNILCGEHETQKDALS